MLPINEAILPISSNCRTGTKRTIKWIVIHETGNKANGANAQAHESYLLNVTNAKTPSVGWHYTVDDHSIYHHVPDDEITWHAGDGGSGTGNVNGIGIEHCVNSDGDFNKTMKNGAEVVGYLLYKYGFKNAGGIVRQHWEFTQKNCPQTIRETGRWQEYLNMCQAELDKLLNPITITPPTPPQPTVDYKALSENLQTQLNNKINEIDILSKDKVNLNTIISQRDNDILNLKSEIGDLQNKNKDLNIGLVSRDLNIEKLTKDIKTQSDTISKITEELNDCKNTITASKSIYDYTNRELINLIFERLKKFLSQK